MRLLRRIGECLVVERAKNVDLKKDPRLSVGLVWGIPACASGLCSGRSGAFPGASASFTSPKRKRGSV